MISKRRLKALSGVAGLLIATVLVYHALIHENPDQDHVKELPSELKDRAGVDKNVTKQNHFRDTRTGIVATVRSSSDGGDKGVTHERLMTSRPTSRIENNMGPLPSYVPNSNFRDLPDATLLSDVAPGYIMEISKEHPVYREQVFQVLGSSPHTPTPGAEFGVGEYMHDQASDDASSWTHWSKEHGETSLAII